MRKIIYFSVLCIFLAGVFAGCSIMDKLGKNNEEIQAASSIAMDESEASKLSDKVPIRLYFANEEGNKLSLEIRYIPMEEAGKGTSNLATIIVDELIKGPTKKELKATLPGNVKQVTPVSVEKGVATVNLSTDIIDSHPGGKAQEQLTIYSIVNSLTELKDIENVQFKINGETRAEFKGNFRFDLPFPRYASIISTEVPKAGDGNDSVDVAKKGAATTAPSNTGTSLKTTEKTSGATPAVSPSTGTAANPSTKSSVETQGTENAAGASSISNGYGADVAEEDLGTTYMQSPDEEEILE